MTNYATRFSGLHIFFDKNKIISHELHDSLEIGVLSFKMFLADF